ncbi:MAG TPA: peptidyl-prolyl cis-trans isomerase [Candidatus Acidoferrum sp.]|jgi:parvulin-like peptidyl-prolyl isomerase
MKYLVVFALLLATAITASSQVASHSPTSAAQPNAKTDSAMQVSDKAVARVNGAVLTDRDLLREMFQIFPYAKQHNGFPKAQEATIRQGALEMIIFEELVYQDAVRLKLTVSPEKLKSAEADFRKQFGSADEYQQFLRAEMGGSQDVVRQKIRRSLLIEQVLKLEVQDKSAVSAAEAKAYYDNNPAKYRVAESFTFQSISVLPPHNASPEQVKEEKKHAQDALNQAKATNSYQSFGLLAEKVSEDDFRVNMGDHKAVERDKLPPQVIAALLAMKPGQVSDLIQIEQAFTIIRLNAHTPARQLSYDEVKAQLRTDLQKSKYEKLRANLDKQLRTKAKVEIL